MPRKPADPTTDLDVATDGTGTELPPLESTAERTAPAVDEDRTPVEELSIRITPIEEQIHVGDDVIDPEDDAS